MAVVSMKQLLEAAYTLVTDPSLESQDGSVCIFTDATVSTSSTCRSHSQAKAVLRDSIAR